MSKYFGASKLGSVLLDEEALVKYRIRTILSGLVADTPARRNIPGLQPVESNLLTLVRTADGNRFLLDEVAETAYDRGGGNDAARRGTEFHTRTDVEDEGKRFKGLDEDLRAYREVTRGFRYTHIEPLVVCDELYEDFGVHVGGRPDRVGYVVTDTKTGRDIYRNQVDISVQMGTYAHSVTYPDRAPLGCRTDIGYVVWVRDGVAKLVEVDLVRGWELARMAASVLRERENDRGLLRAVESTEHSRRTSIDRWLKAQILLRCRTEEDLNALWTNNLKSWTKEHTALATDLKSRLLSDGAERDTAS